MLDAKMKDRTASSSGGKRSIGAVLAVTSGVSLSSRSGACVAGRRAGSLGRGTSSALWKDSSSLSLPLKSANDLDFPRILLHYLTVER